MNLFIHTLIRSVSMDETLKDLMEKQQEINKQLQEFKKQLSGKVVILFGKAWIGKSLFALTFSNLFTHSKLYLIDKNYPQDFFRINKNIQVVEIDSPKQLDLMLSKENSLDDKLIIIDSITTLQTSFIRESYFSPRAYLEFNNFADKVAKKLSELTPKTTSLIIAHEKIKNWETQEAIPRVNWTMLRNTEVLVRMYEENGKRKLKIIAKRELPQKVEWYFE